MTNSSNASAALRAISEDPGHAEATSSTGQSPGQRTIKYTAVKVRRLAARERIVKVSA